MRNSLSTTFLLVCLAAVASPSSTTQPTEWKYPSKQLYRLIQDRLQTTRRSVDHHEGAWSEWTSWTPCSRTCGGGVSTQTRQCNSRAPLSRRRRSVTGVVALRSRRNSSNVDDDPNRLNGLETANGARASCVGLYKRYHMCNTQECPTGSIDFRQQQCESHNGKPFMGRQYMWEAYWDGENPCELNCRALTFRFYAALNKTVVDGTLCRQNDPTRVCVAGSCKSIGCDGIVGSEKRPDACGVCGGNNSTCQIVSGIFTEPQLPAGYNLVAQLPKGACHVNITEFKPSRNYLALRRSDGTFVFNGNWAINWSGEYQAAGSTFLYRRQDATNPELISTDGPLSEPLDIMVISQQLNPGIKYEYMLPLGAANNLVPRSNPTVPASPAGIPILSQQSDSAGRYQLDATAPQVGNSPAYPKPARVTGLGAEGGLLQAIQQSGSAGLPGIQNAPSPASIPSSLSSSGSLANLGISVPPFVPSASDNVAVTFPPAVQESPRPTEPASGARSNKRRHNGHHKHHHNSGATQLESQGKHSSPELQAIDASVPAPPTPSRRGPRRHAGSGKGFVWKHVGFSECSKTCGGGVQQALIVCVRESNQAPVSDHRCKEEDRLPAETARCNLKPCPAEWVLGEWGPCSASCGDGIQTRDMTCKQEISATLTMRVNEAACLNPVPALPRVRNCNLGTCAKWHASEWGKCSTSCGKGMRHRRVVCQGFDGRDANDADCPANDKPPTSDICDMGSCSTNTWFFTEWTGQCSEDCGSGVQTRKAHCSGAVEADCDAAKKPDTARTCVSNKDCSGKWFTGPWSQCSAPCDEGTKTREVICLTFMRGQYRVGLDIQCPARDKPNATASCNLGKCLPQWYTTDWSECSATCGTGAQRREVKCLDANQAPSLDCREEDRPMMRHACTARACNEVTDEVDRVTAAQDTPVISVESNRNESESSPSQDPPKSRKASKHSKAGKVEDSPPAVDSISANSSIDAADAASSGDCTDKFKNCHLVVQARLCKLKYYLVSCCASCSKPKT